MGVVFVSVMLAYAMALFFLTRKWLTLPETSHNVSTTNHLKITVVVPVRNEAPNILDLLNCILQQEYPNDAFEVIVVDDQSTDNTYELVDNFRKQSPTPIQLLRSSPAKGSPKKQALELAIDASDGQIILTTDGDCRVGPYWLQLINASFQQKEIQLAMAPVSYQLNSLTDRLQWIEFSALQGLSAVLLHLGIPAMGNGANLAYRKSTFLAVNGFDGNRAIASGDDEFLVRKVAERYGTGSINYVKSVQATVSTQPARGWTDIKNQKVRWSSKWKHQSGMASWLLPLLILVINTLPLLGIMAYNYSLIGLEILILGWLLKGVGDMSFSYAAARFLRHPHRLVDLMIAEIIYPVYVLFFGLASIFGKYTWKDRRYNE